MLEADSRVLSGMLQAAEAGSLGSDGAWLRVHSIALHQGSCTDE